MSDDIAVGIDLGTSYSAVATAAEGRPEVLANEWGERNHASVVSFLEDGTVTIFSAVERTPYTGSYRVFDRDRLEITMKKGGTLTWGYAVTKGELTLTAPTGVEMKYRRYRGR